MVERRWQVTLVAEGSGFEKNIRVTLASPITIREGLQIEVFKDTTVASLPVHRQPAAATALPTQTLSPGRPIRFSVGSRGVVTLELFDLNGMKLGTLYQGTIGSGRHSVVWNGATDGGAVVGSRSVILRLSTADGHVTRQVPVLR